MITFGYRKLVSFSCSATLTILPTGNSTTLYTAHRQTSCEITSGKTFTWQTVRFIPKLYLTCTLLTILVTGDGKCDFVIVNRHHGAVRIVRNDYNAATNKFSWTDSGVWTDNNQNVVCDDTYGIGLFDLGVRFADLDGEYSLQKARNVADIFRRWEGGLFVHQT